MKIYQNMRFRNFATIMLGVFAGMFTILFLSGGFAALSTNLVLFLLEMCVMVFMIMHSDGHICYTIKANAGYKYFRSLPDFEDKFLSHSVKADILAYGAGVVIAVINAITKMDSIHVLTVAAYFVVLASLRLGWAVSGKYGPAILFAKIGFYVTFMVTILRLYIDKDIPADFITADIGLIMYGAVTALVLIQLIVYYKRAEYNLHKIEGGK